MKPLALFDIDGTLLLTGGAGLRAFDRAALELFGESAWFRGIETAGGLDPVLFAEAARRRGLVAVDEPHAAFRERYLRLLPDVLVAGAADVRALPGIHASLERLRSEGNVVLGLLTGNYAPAIPIKLGAVGIDHAWFDVAATGDDAATRPALVPIALERYQRRLGTPIDPERVVVIGDTPRDVECAHENGCQAFAVATGKYSVELLEAAGADVVVRDLSDPKPLFDLFERLSD